MQKVFMFAIAAVVVIVAVVMFTRKQPPPAVYAHETVSPDLGPLPLPVAQQCSFNVRLSDTPATIWMRNNTDCIVNTDIRLVIESSGISATQWMHDHWVPMTTKQAASLSKGECLSVRLDYGEVFVRQCSSDTLILNAAPTVRNSTKMVGPLRFLYLDHAEFASTA
jgi:hypothetical protein